MDAIVAILTRRSTRRFDNKIPNKELIQKVVNAGRYVPSGANSQTSHFIVITNKEALKEKADGILMTDRKEFI
ncbi:nitroreductase family protein [Ruminococcus sp.]|uniref:nitroreductase family protein n=1 Tax=Ruminococcus sp. TaxID=41978 RepID=UPI0038646DE5